MGEPWFRQGPGHRLSRARRETGQGKAGTALERNSIGLTNMGGKRRQLVAAGGTERRPGGRLYATGKWGGGGRETGARIERSGVDG